MKKFLFLSSLMASLMVPCLALGQTVPSQSNVTAFNDAVAQFNTDFATYEAASGTVTADQVLVNSATAQLAVDTAAISSYAGTIAVDLTNIQSALQNLTPAQQVKARETVLRLMRQQVGATAAVCDQDDVDLAQSAMNGFGSRLAVGPYRDMTLSLRQYLADHVANNPQALANFKAALGRTPSPARQCKFATFAVIALTTFNSFQPIPDYTVILAELQAIQAAACGTPVPTKAVPCETCKATVPATNWLSTQFILDGCAGSNGGCNGDDNTTVLGDAKNMGIPLEADYGPYQAQYQGCHAISGSGVMMYTLSDWLYVDPSTTGVGSTDLIKAAIMQYGGVGCAVAADGAFENYSGGVFSGRATGINHDVYLAGWDDSKGAWLMINSWGPGWGISPVTGQKANGPKRVYLTGAKLPAPAVRAAQHARSRATHAQAAADLAKAKATLPASYSGIGVQPGIADQAQCGTCWDFSGIRCVSTANILAGNLPPTDTSTWAGGCMWIAYGSNEIGTEPVVGVAGKPVPYVAPPNPGPQPNSPTRRSSIQFEKATRMYTSGDPAQKAKVEKALLSVETILGE